MNDSLDQLNWLGTYTYIHFYTIMHALETKKCHLLIWRCLVFKFRFKLPLASFWTWSYDSCSSTCIFSSSIGESFSLMLSTLSLLWLVSKWSAIAGTDSCGVLYQNRSNSLFCSPSFFYDLRLALRQWSLHVRMHFMEFPLVGIGATC